MVMSDEFLLITIWQKWWEKFTSVKLLLILLSLFSLSAAAYSSWYFTYDSGLKSTEKLAKGIREHMTEDVADLLTKTMENCEKSATFTSKAVESGLVNTLIDEEFYKAAELQITHFKSSSNVYYIRQDGSMKGVFCVKEEEEEEEEGEDDHDDGDDHDDEDDHDQEGDEDDHGDEEEEDEDHHGDDHQRSFQRKGRDIVGGITFSRHGGGAISECKFGRWKTENGSVYELIPTHDGLKYDDWVMPARFNESLDYTIVDHDYEDSMEWVNSAYFRNNRFLVSVSHTLVDENEELIGVLGVGVELNFVSSTLMEEHEDGSIKFVFERASGNMIGISTGDSVIYTDSNGESQLKKIYESKEKLVKIASTYMKKKYGGWENIKEFVPGKYSSSGKTYYVDVLPFQRSNIDWIICIVVDEDIYLGDIKSQTETTLIIVTVFIFATIIVNYAMTSLITNPLKLLTVKMMHISRLNLDEAKEFSSTSYFKEINGLQQSFSFMKKALGSFSKYVPLEVLKSLLEHHNFEAKLWVERRVCTIFFSDIASFTTISEKNPPQKLIAFLADYFEEMAAAIIGLEGTIGDYIGDAVFAFWNSPNDVEDHAKKACRASLIQKKKLEEINRLNKHGIPDVGIRIGLNTGPVLSGNVGSNMRMKFSLIGDAVNLAARLEGMGKMYGVMITMSEETYKLVKDEFLGRPMDKVAVAGKSQGVMIYELLCSRADATTADFKKSEDCQKILDYYFSCEFQQAIETIDTYLVDYPKDKAMKMVRDHSVEFLKSPPEPDWDGVYHYHVKG